MTSARYRQVADDLRERIALGDVGAGGTLESEAELGRRYGASRMTVRKALESLRDEGLVTARQGAGWFVAGRSFAQRLALGTFRHAESAVATSGARLRRTVTGFDYLPAPGHIAALLAVPPGTEVLRVRSVRRTAADDPAATEPLERATEWVPAALAEPLSRASAADPGIWNSLQRSGSAIATVRQSMTAGVAGELDNELLAATLGTPLLLIRRVAVAADGTPVAVSDHRYLAHRFSLEVEFNGWSGTDPPGLRATGPD